MYSVIVGSFGPNRTSGDVGACDWLRGSNCMSESECRRRIHVVVDVWGGVLVCVCVGVCWGVCVFV